MVVINGHTWEAKLKLKRQCANHVGGDGFGDLPRKTALWTPELADSALVSGGTKLHAQDTASSRGGGRTPMPANMSPNARDSNNASDTMSPPEDSGSNAKRKSEDGSGQPRAKRNRYISIAWYGRAHP
jgi:hypothetical protein